MTKYKYSLKNLQEDKVTLDNLSSKLSKMEPFQIDLDSLMPSVMTDLDLREEDKDNEGAWWSYLAEALTGLSLAKKLAQSKNILVKDGISSLEKIEAGLRDTLKNKIENSPKGKEWWSQNKDKRSKITKASRAMADKIIEKLNKEKILDKYVLSLVVASGGNTGGVGDKADIRLSFTPIEDYKITPKDIGISLKTSLKSNSTLTVQPQVGRFARFISLGDEAGEGN
jgi:hypothetical protein